MRGSVDKATKPSFLDLGKNDDNSGSKPSLKDLLKKAQKRRTDAAAGSPTHHDKSESEAGAKKIVQGYNAPPPASKFWSRWKSRKGGKANPDEREVAVRPLIELVMIVRNEEKSIVGIIESVKPWVDRYTIVDTGSTDNTVPLIRSTFGDTPGNVFLEKFVDFATTRNRAIELAGTQSVFILMLSGDEYLQNGAALRKFCQAHREWKWTAQGARHEAYNMRVKFGRDVYDSTRLSRTDAQWYYVGVTHEYMTNRARQVATIRVQTGDGSGADDVPAIFHDLSNNVRSDKMKRWRLDLNLLLGDWQREPNRTRTAFYVAQSYECLGEYENAFKWYKRRFELRGWVEEAYEAKFRMGRCSHNLGRPWIESQQHYLDAHAHLPARAEPLYAVADYWYKKHRNYPLTYLYALRAASIDFPSHLRLFIDKTVYDFKAHDILAISAFYLKEWNVGEAAARRALKQYPNDKRLKKNLWYYTRRHKQ